MAHRHSSTQSQHFSIDSRTQVSLYFFTDGTLVQRMSLGSEHCAPSRDGYIQTEIIQLFEI